MSKEILVESYFPEETRVAVVERGKIVSLDVSAGLEKHLRGNIYLGIVSRIEPGLQAAFVDYGEERKGFLPFDCIHVNYYDLPKEDLEDLQAHVKKAAEEECKNCGRLLSQIRDNLDSYNKSKSKLLNVNLSIDFVEAARKEIEKLDKKSLLKKLLSPWKKDELVLDEPNTSDEESVREFSSVVVKFAKNKLKSAKGKRKDIYNKLLQNAEGYLKNFLSRVKTMGDLESILNELSSDLNELAHMAHFREKSREILRCYVDRERRILEGESVNSSSKSEVNGIIKDMMWEQESLENETKALDGKDIPLSSYGVRFLRKKYSIQEVIKKGSLIVVQVTKEERGNKGALLTTHLSLAGRYCILMPNTSRKYGISRKIKDTKERQKLKKVVSSFNLRPDMSIILRTAGKFHEEDEIRDDLEYLLKLWNGVFETTTNSQAPSLVYEECNQLARVVRDICSPDISKITVQGEAAFQEIKRVAELMLPSVLGKIEKSDSIHPLFVEKKVEKQVAGLVGPDVQLKSGGHLVINPTEALTAIDVNSGQSNQSYSVEETAFKNNMEAAEEVIRQLILRDIGGLIAVDLIDMESGEHIRAVEKAFREHAAKDSSRVKILPISQLGILEISRQRKQNSLDHIIRRPCPTCGEGRVLSTEHRASALIREMHQRIIHTKKNLKKIKIHAEQDVAMHILKQYKDHMDQLKEIRGITVSVETGDDRVEELEDSSPRNSTGFKPLEGAL